MLYEIAEHRVRITSELEIDMGLLLRSYSPFVVEDDGGEAVIDLTLCSHMKAIPEEDCTLNRDVETGNGIIKVMKIENGDRFKCQRDVNVSGGYQFVVFDIHSRPCALLITDAWFHHCYSVLRNTGGGLHYALNSILMLCYSFATAPHDTLLVHASVVRHRGTAYAFTAKSGVGKSTQVSNWLRFIPDCDLINDDNPILRVMDGRVYIYGSPWSGKTPCYRNVKVPLGGMAQICRDTRNYLLPLRPFKSFSLFTVSCSSMKWDERIRSANYDTVEKVLNVMPFYELHCLPDKESAEVASAEMSGGAVR